MRGVRNHPPEWFTAEYLARVISYDPHTGIFIWIKNSRRTDLTGLPAGNIQKWGYREISFRDSNRKVRFKAHCVAWFIMTGDWPTFDIDHRNGNRDDNSWSNLREATRSQNNMNSGPPKNNSSGVKGVRWNQRYRKWESNIRINGSAVYLGRFFEFEDAVSARKIAEIQAFGEFSRHA